jgi:hypothetical protein
MPRLLAPLAALLLFVGLGFVTRPLFRHWLEGKLADAEAAAAKERPNWKPVETNFSGMKLDQPIIMKPSDFFPPQQHGPKSNGHPVSP